MKYFRQVKNACLLAGLAIAMLVSAASGFAYAQSLKAIVDRGTVRFGYIVSPPSITKDPISGELGGFSVSAAREIAKQMGLKAEFVETTWGNFVAGLQSGQFDISIAGTFATIKRAMVVDFTTPIAYLGYGALVRSNDNRFAAFKDMNSKDIRIAVVQGGSAEDYARRNFPEAKIITLSTGNLTAPFVEVVSNRADVAIEDTATMNSFIKRQPSVQNIYKAHPYNFTPVAWAVAKGNDAFLRVMNVGIDILISSGQLDEMAADGDIGSRFLAIPNLVEFPRKK